MTLVLLVDDDVKLLRALRTLVMSGGYRVHTAVDGFDALDSVTRELPDLIVSDVMMPRMDGIDLVRALKTNPALAHTGRYAIGRRFSDRVAATRVLSQTVSRS